MTVEGRRSWLGSGGGLVRVVAVAAIAVVAAGWFVFAGPARQADPDAGSGEPIGRTIQRSGPVVPGAISDGLVRVGFADFDLDEGMAVDMRFPVPEAGDGGSQTFAIGWWLRSDGDADRQPQPLPTAISYVDDTAWFDFGPVGADGIAAELVVVARDTSAEEEGPADGTRGTTSWRLVLTNPGPDDRTIELVVYGDVDAGGTPGGDLVELIASDEWLRVGDLSAEYDVDLRGHGADHFWAGDLDPAELGLVDALFGDVAMPAPNPPLPLSPLPGDVELALGWEQVVVPAGGSTLVSWVVSVNEPAGGPPQPVATPASLGFGTVLVGQTSSSSTLTLSNPGGIPTEMTWSDPGTPFVRSGGTCGQSPLLLDPATTCTLEYRFAPTSAGTASAEVIVRDAQFTTEFSLTGVGQATATSAPTTTAPPPTTPPPTPPTTSPTTPTVPPAPFPALPGYVPLTPARLLDTRPGGATVDGGFTPGVKLGADDEIRLRVLDRGRVPGDATAVVLNVTVNDADEAGFITVYPCGQARPNASNLNYSAGQTIPNAVVVQVGAGGDVCLYSFQGTHLIVDVNGAFVPGGGS